MEITRMSPLKGVPSCQVTCQLSDLHSLCTNYLSLEWSQKTPSAMSMSPPLPSTMSLQNIWRGKCDGESQVRPIVELSAGNISNICTCNSRIRIFFIEISSNEERIKIINPLMRTIKWEVKSVLTSIDKWGDWCRWNQKHIPLAVCQLGSVSL